MAELGHSWDLPIIQPRLRMTENHCNPTATWLVLENGLKWPLFFSFRAGKMAVKKGNQIVSAGPDAPPCVIGPWSHM